MEEFRVRRFAVIQEEIGLEHREGDLCWSEVSRKEGKKKLSVERKSRVYCQVDCREIFRNVFLLKFE